ncbi:penicillin-binding protein, partial [Escherichia coli]|nr:penicillin-binding protein [Escherichia coli]
ATESFVGYTPQVAVAGIAANPDDPSDPVGAAVQARVIDAVARIIGTAVEGQPEQAFTPPSPELVGTPRRPVEREPRTEPRRTEEEDPLSDLRRWLQNRRG